jgi:hypothetical protein
MFFILSRNGKRMKRREGTDMAKTLNRAGFCAAALLLVLALGAIVCKRMFD